MVLAKKEGLIVIGLSDENMTRLKNGEPIVFDLNKLELNEEDVKSTKVIIFNGTSEESMFMQFIDQIDLQKTKMK